MKLCVTICVSFVSSCCEVVSLFVSFVSSNCEVTCHYVCVICEQQL